MRPFSTIVWSVVVATISCQAYGAVIAGGLEWDKKVALAQSSWFDSRLVVEFPFNNPNDKTIVIRRIVPDCGCLTPQLQQTTFAPHEASSLLVIVDLAAVQSGKRSWNVVVATDYQADSIVSLRVEVEVPEVVAIDKNHLVWAATDNSRSQQITIKRLPGAPKIASPIISADPSKMTVEEIDEISAGDAYSIRVRPRSSEPISADVTITITPLGQLGPRRLHYVFVTVVQGEGTRVYGALGLILIALGSILLALGMKRIQARHMDANI